MLDAIKTFLSELAGGESQSERFREDDYRVAAAALLVHALHVDGDISAVERAKLHDVLRERFGLDGEATRALVEEAVVIEGEAVDLYRFTSLLNRALGEEERRRIVEMMWELAYADGRVNEFEDNLIWRVADLLGVSARERLTLRRQIAAETDVDPRSVNRTRPRN